MKSLITYFSKRHLITNVFFFGLIFLTVFVWFQIGKEEMPEFASNWVRVNTVYPGAPAKDVELFVTKPIEDELKGVVGIEDISSTSSVGVSSFRIVLDDDYPDKIEVMQEIKDAVSRVDLPSEVRDQPNIRQFKSSEKAILDIGLYHKGHKVLDQKSRVELQKYVLSLENQLLALKEISSVDRSYYKKPELQILIDANKKLELEVPLALIKRQIQENHIRVPIGSMKDKGESKVTALNEYEDVESLNELILRGNYEGGGVRLGDFATIRDGFEKSNTIFKVNGHEGIFLNVKKSISTDILSAQAAVMKFIKNYNDTHKDSNIGIVLMDDESFAVQNRLSIITTNGLIGFALIVIILCLFMDLKTSFWVAMGIPFSIAFTLVIANMVGYTVNNMTLAGIIIVLGIVVDDAIIIAENIARHREEGMSTVESAIQGAHEVFRPIVASIITTCVAFLPLIYFEGFFGKLVGYIPLIVILMLGGSLIESLFILPSHLANKTPLLERFSTKSGEKTWFHKYEEKYEAFLLKAFKFRIPVLASFLALLIGAVYIFKTEMKFVMFPREESKEVIIKVKTKKGTSRQETARLIDPIEMMFALDKENVVGVRASIAKSRRGGEVRDNEASVLVELHPADQRSLSLNQLLERWEDKVKDFPNLVEVKFLRGRWGHDSGSSIELEIREHDNKKRLEIANLIHDELKKLSYINEVEIEEPLMKREYLFKIKQDKLIRLEVKAQNITTALRTFVEGSILYSINKGEEEVDVRLSVHDEVKTDLNQLLKLKVENNQGQLITLAKLVEIQEIKRPVNIKRSNFKRSIMIYGDLKEDVEKTPLEVAKYLEKNIFPNILKKYSSSLLGFKGEIEDSRESQGEFLNSVYIVIILIYLILVVMFDSMIRPLLVMVVIPFGLAGVIYVLLLHGMSVYGFFAAIGALGMIGVVINDAIVMIDKIETSLAGSDRCDWQTIAHMASLRLRPILLTTFTTVAGIIPTAYGIAGYDSMLAEMMLTMGWGLAFGTFITLLLIPCLYSFLKRPAHLNSN